ncbi:MAG: MgtC/SapB family protein, partial [Acidovorax sp.]
AAIGVAAGLGRETTAVLSTLLALLVLWAMPMLHDRMARTATQPRREDD